MHTLASFIPRLCSFRVRYLWTASKLFILQAERLFNALSKDIIIIQGKHISVLSPKLVTLNVPPAAVFRAKVTPMLKKSASSSYNYGLCAVMWAQRENSNENLRPSAERYRKISIMDNQKLSAELLFCTPKAQRNCR